MRGGQKKKPSIQEERLNEIRQFLEVWIQFHKSYKRAYKGEEITSESEMDFLKMKSNLARRHQILMLSLEDDYLSGDSIRPILSQTVTLRQLSSIRPEHYEKIEKAWHNTYIHLNESLGRLKYQIETGK